MKRWATHPATFPTGVGKAKKIALQPTSSTPSGYDSPYCLLTAHHVELRNMGTTGSKEGSRGHSRPHGVLDIADAGRCNTLRVSPCLAVHVMVVAGRKLLGHVSARLPSMHSLGAERPSRVRRGATAEARDGMVAQV